MEDNILPEIGESSLIESHIPKRTVRISNAADPRESNLYDHFGENMPILWTREPHSRNRNYPHRKLQEPTGDFRDKISGSNVRQHKLRRLNSAKKDGGDYDDGDDEESLKNMPNTVGPNPNIYGGFPENDIWGNFELPTPETIDKLKNALGTHIATGKQLYCVS